MLKRLFYITLTTIMIFTLTACAKEKHAKNLFEELGFSLESLPVWEAQIKYIDENRGSFDDTYTMVKYSSDNPNELLNLINCFEGAQATDAPTDLFFSAEGMSEYIVDFYTDGTDTPVLSFYYYSGSNLISRVIRSYDDKKQIDIIEYEFYTPYGDLLSLVNYYRSLAIEPESNREGRSLNQKQLVATVKEEELEERMTYYDDEYTVEEGAELGEIEFEIYGGELPDDDGTACKLYDTSDIPSLPEDKVVLMARIADDKGEPLDLLITFVEFNTTYTIVSVEEPQTELLEELGITVDNAIMLNKDDINKDKYIVFVNSDNEVLYVVVPFAN